VLRVGASKPSGLKTRATAMVISVAMAVTNAVNRLLYRLL